MIFLKEELSFLSMYSKCSDTKLPEHDKFKINVNSEKGEVTFSQFSDEIVLITTLNKTSDTSFEVVFPVNQFFAFINSIPVNAEIDIQSNGIHFNGNRYEFETVDLSSIFEGVDAFKDLVKDTSNKVSIVNFGLIKNSIIGNSADQLDCTMLTNGSFVSAPNNESLLCAYKTSNNKDVSFYIPRLAGIIGVDNKKEVMDFYKSGEYVFINVNNTHIIFTAKEYNLPNIFDEDFKQIYDHPSKIEINKNILKDAINRIKIFSAKNIFNRIKCSSTNSQFIIESKEPNSGYAIEKIEASIDDALKEQETLFYVSQTILSTAINALKGEKIIIHSNVYTPDEKTIKVTDEIGDDFFIVVLVSE